MRAYFYSINVLPLTYYQYYPQLAEHMPPC